MNAKASLLGALLVAAGVVGACSSKTDAPPTQTKGTTTPPGGGGSSSGGGTEADSGVAAAVDAGEGGTVKECSANTGCTGCCDTLGNCQSGTTNTFCGINGNPCTACNTLTQPSCVAASCQ